MSSRSGKGPATCEGLALPHAYAGRALTQASASPQDEALALARARAVRQDIARKSADAPADNHSLTN